MTKDNPKIEALKPVPIFATPDSMEEMQNYLAKFTNSEATVAQVSAFMMYNLMCKYIKETYHTQENSDAT